MRLILPALLALTGPAFADFTEINDCGGLSDELTRVGDFVSDNWNSFESFIEAEVGISLTSCLENRFKTNGKVDCETSAGVCGGGVASGWGSPGYMTAHLCWDPFLDQVATFQFDDNQEACLLALVTEFFARTCSRNQETSQAMGEAAYDWFDSRSSTNVTLDFQFCEGAWPLPNMEGQLP